MSASAPQSNSRPSSRGRETYRPTTPLRETSRSRDSVNRFRDSHTTFTPIESITPFFAELEDGLNILHDNLLQLQQIHENINRFNENFSAMIYGMEMNAFCVDFPEAPIPQSFRREEEAAREAERLAALQPAPRADHDAETTFMTNDTFVDQPVTPAASRDPKTPNRRGRGNIPGTTRGGGRGGTGRGSRGTGIARGSSRGSREGEASDIANVPLQERQLLEERDLFKLLVCHDFKGGYQPYEDSQGVLSEEPVYTLEYLHLVSTFVYFSHHRVTIPPAPWINVMHKNGVRILGTFIVEPGNTTGFSDLLERDANGTFIFVEKLAGIAEYYGFDGWLLNFEEHFPDTTFNLETTLKFIEELRKESDRRVKGSEIVWLVSLRCFSKYNWSLISISMPGRYDSLTIYNRVVYVNGLSPLNAPFFDVSSALFTNYRWNPLAQLLTTAALSKVMHRNYDVYMGIDVFGRGTFGGGGWGTGTALSVIRPAGLSAAIFAPGWVFENFDGRNFEERNRKFWINGEATDTELICRPVAEFAPVWEAGTEAFFYTDFNRGYGKKWFQSGREISARPWVHVGAQSVLPSFYPEDTDLLVWKLDNEAAYNGGYSLQIVHKAAAGADAKLSSCKLYQFNMAYKRDLQFSFSYTLEAAQKGRVAVYFILKRFNGVTERHEVGLPVQEGWGIKTVTLDVGKTDDEIFGTKVVELGIAYIHPEAFGEPETKILRLGHICLSGYPEQKLPGISKISSAILASGKQQLNWVLDYSGFSPSEGSQLGVKSKVTGEFAYFLVYKGLGELLGISHCLGFITGVETGSDNSTYRVDGISFDGRVVKGAWF
ncbi:hypothetical protein TWF191_009061 [Orbilia oligospora]|uniref:Cytosolic endo-beta-N-acetylglucosaminidase TIM barrel domain-containing protein n=1 Tax=Orbilia oligospora TaxID=2813651 RepID=A0A7C8QMT1_ORBOL|nr:hypothetical protein TWF191_009061 [Orbilia oligospora]